MGIEVDNQIDEAVRRYRLGVEGIGFGSSLIIMPIYIAWRAFAIIQQAGGDLNFDGQVTISDVWIAFVGALHEPGNFLATHLGDGFWSFFEIRYWMVPLWITIPISLFVYLMVMGFITTLIEGALVLQYRTRVSFQLKPRIMDHLLPGDKWVIGGIGVFIVVVIFVSVWG